ncbi:MgtC/SapB family protein [Hyalangium minutum]|uniref:Mg(2+) transport ATPase protein C n=1 Tax=Hyalangium minutum TaxID=394096 RepID=A0A085WMT7_9BACT|nr:MgtC/SapB family protein [Hyalangium minutum]KFE69000.1 Mg(2+) transport ATPase protein C [Hyalangium minutum]
MDERTLIARLALALVLGGLLGLERELRGHAAGLRTHLLVSLGSCLFTLVSVTAGQAVDSAEPSFIRADVTRIASQIVVGIGFLGGGAIFRHGTSVHGLTTAANLWLTASVGLAAGFGFFLGASVTVGFALVVLVGLRPVEHWIERFSKRHRIAKDSQREPEAPRSPPQS